MVIVIQRVIKIVGGLIKMDSTDKLFSEHGTLVVNKEKGLVIFYEKESHKVILRISNLPTPMELDVNDPYIDIQYNVGVDYR
jgi:hypothetical protein